MFQRTTSWCSSVGSGMTASRWTLRTRCARCRPSASRWAASTASWPASDLIGWPLSVTCLHSRPPMWLDPVALLGLPVSGWLTGAQIKVPCHFDLVFWLFFLRLSHDQLNSQIFEFLEDLWCFESGHSASFSLCVHLMLLMDRVFFASQDHTRQR